MSSYIQNYGFAKTIILNDKQDIHNEIKWQGDYDGKNANIDVDVNDNGNRELLSIQLNNNDIRQLFGIQPVQVPLEKRLVKDFLYHTNKPIALEGALIKRKSRRHRKKSRKNKKKRKTQKLY